MKKIPLARYLFTRLAQHKVQHMHGVPGDFTLKSLDHLSPSGVKWINSCNELNAGYAADGYSRIRGLGALMTTYGVGELSAINAIAGSYAEYVPVVGIVGTPRRELQATRANVHHTLGDGRPRVFAEMARHVTVAQANLIHDDEEALVEAVDDVLATCLRESQPVYVELPCDMVAKQVDGTRLDTTTLDVDVKSDARAEKDAVDAVLQRLGAAKQPLILVDSGHGVRGFRTEINAFVQKSGIPTLAMPSGNGLVEHSLRNFYGVHSGPVGQIDTMPYVSGADVVLAIGPMFSDTQTLGWSVVPEADKIITLAKKSIEFPGHGHGHGGHSRTININIQSFLTTLTEAINPSSLATPDTSSLGDFRSIAPASADLSAPIDQTNFYLHLSKYLRQGDTVLLANATPILGGRDLVLPPKATSIASGQWFSIGHMLPAAQGAALAQQQGIQDQETTTTTTTKATGNDDHHLTPWTLATTPCPPISPRTILLEGDGSFQVTAQELSTAIRYGIPLTVMIINNNGYAYERQIHGMHEDYNDLAPWRYADLGAKFFGADDYGPEHRQAYPIWTRRISTWKELDDTLADEAFNEAKGLKVLEVGIGKYDVPEKFKSVFQAAGEKLG
ncbi:hypothetical protein PV10_03800 [Exophiala mesophila]|uniref:Pyruvate decarboxylase n=1 Tax=Exophiala mesophila TaxID=212818 RepID=A0A0D1ZFA1_EXOME|nr:uncharacterized protein PV10_03800 [Exophiala mesophila]KIV92509.1 hypothetical protein PV10_03800 [Exophiala mesophila]